MLSKEEKRNYYNNTLNYVVNNKTVNVNNIVDGIFNKTLTMFLYNNLPDTLPIEEIEKILQLNGTGFITKIDEKIVILQGSYNYEKVDIYNRPYEINCYLPNKRKYQTFKIDDGVIIKNDYLERGLLPIFKKWGYLINESEITLIMANKFKRMIKTFIANDDPTAESVKRYLNKIDNGETSLIIGNILYDSIKVDGETNSNTLHELIEYDNYIKSELYKEIGLYSNDNMKKERLVTSEIETGLNSIYPLVDNMLNCRKQAITKVNEKYNTNITVEFTSSWEYRLNLGDNLTNKDIKDDEQMETIPTEDKGKQGENIPPKDEEQEQGGQ